MESESSRVSDPVRPDQEVSGDTTAQRSSADAQKTGESVRIAALKGDPEAQYHLALSLVGNEKLEAYKWFVLSHALGSTKSLLEIQKLTPQLSQADIGKVRYDLALSYASGRGTAVDLKQAYMWMALAASAGVPDSDRQLQLISGQMSPDQIAVAKRRTEAWLARMNDHTSNSTAAITVPDKMRQ
jgi:TPR repeat protein